MDFHHEIADLAYELYLNSGCAEGRDIENWLEAERIIHARHRLYDTSTVRLSEVSAFEEPKKKRVVKARAKKDKQNGSSTA